MVQCSNPGGDNISEKQAAAADAYDITLIVTFFKVMD
jgi:hypothetical protein